MEIDWYKYIKMAEEDLIRLNNWLLYAVLHNQEVIFNKRGKMIVPLSGVHEIEKNIGFYTKLIKFISEN